MPFASDTRQQFSSLFSLYEWVTVVTAAIIFAVVLFAAWRYRRRPGRKPSEKHEAYAVELVYALVLVGAVALLVTRAFTRGKRVDSVASNVNERVQVTAFKWGWRFTYPRTGVSVVGDN